MHRLVPDLILQHDAAGEREGGLDAGILFADIAGFSAITDDLMAHGQDGSEVLATIMRRIFEPLVRRVVEQGGFIAHFAGDAFMAVFPGDVGRVANSPYRALAAAWAMQTDVAALPPQHTRYGEFSLAVKVGLDFGALRWGIVRSEDGRRACYYFQGPAVDGAAVAEHAAHAGEVILSRAMFDQVEAEVNVEGRGEHYRLAEATLSLEAEPVALPDIDLAQAQRFFPRSLWETTTPGEFRQVVNVFISLPTVRTQAQLAIFMQTIFDLQRRYGGLLNRLDFGDKGANLLLFWGAPVAYENDTRRALQFILDLQAQTEVPINGGVTCREAHAGHIGSSLAEEYTCYGRGVNLAARFMTAAPRGEIWVDENVRCAAAGQFDLEFVDQMTFKGFAEPQKVYRLVERKEEAEFGYEGALVGREAELAALAEFVRPITAGQFAGMLVAYGEPGIGKSRLIHEFLAMDDRTSSIDRRPWSIVHRPRSIVPQTFIAQTDQILRESLNPFRYWLKRYFGVSDMQVEARNKRSFNRKLDDLVACTEDRRLADELDRTRSCLGALVGLHWPDSLYEQLDAQGRHENMLIGLTILLQAESLRQPAIFFLEDAHWLDDDSKAFLPRLVRALGAGSRPYAIAILATARYEGAGLPLEGFNYQRIDLDQLSRSDLARLAEAFVGGAVASSLLDLLDDRAEGNPFFAEQILRYLREEDLLTLAEGTWQIVGGAGRAPLPTTVQSMLVARLDRLTQEVKEVVQTAAILGREFEVRLLAQMLENDALLHQKITHAEQAAIWAALSEIRYIFKHALLRDAAYNMQVQARRTQLHALAVMAMEEVYKADPSTSSGQGLAPHYGALAFHSEQAGVTAWARRYLELAGDASRAAYQNSQATDYYTRGLALTPAEDAAARFRLLLAREAVYDRQGDREAQVRDLDALDALAQASGNLSDQAEVALRRAQMLGDSDWPATIAAAQAALALAQAGGDRGREADAHRRWASALNGLGNYPGAQEHFLQALSLAQAAGHRALEESIIRGLGSVAYYQGNYAEARTRWEQSLAVARVLSDRHGEQAMLSNLGVLAQQQGDYAVAQAYLEETLVINREMGARAQEGGTLNNLGAVLMDQGDYAGAQTYLERALVVCREVDDREGEHHAQYNLGFAAWFQGDYGGAEEQYQRSLDEWRELGDRQMEAYALHKLGDVALAQGSVAEAMARYEQSLALCREIGSRDGEGQALTGLGDALTLSGALTEAEGLLQSAVAVRRELGQRPRLMETLAALARVHLARGDAAQALAVVEETLAFLDAGGHFNGTEYRLRNNLTCYQVLRANDDPRAESVLQTAYDQLQAEAARIPDPDERRSFLENIAWHREISAAWMGEGGILV